MTYIEIVGDVTETLPTPEPYEATQYWIKFLPAVTGQGFDAGPLLVRVDQVRTPSSVERVEGKLVLRDLASDHDAMLSHPKDVAALLNEIAARL